MRVSIHANKKEIPITASDNWSGIFILNRKTWNDKINLQLDYKEKDIQHCFFFFSLSSLTNYSFWRKFYSRFSGSTSRWFPDRITVNQSFCILSFISVFFFILLVFYSNYKCCYNASNSATCRAVFCFPIFFSIIRRIFTQILVSLVCLLRSVIAYHILVQAHPTSATLWKSSFDVNVS